MHSQVRKSNTCGSAPYSDCAGTLNWTNINGVNRRNGITTAYTCPDYEFNYRWCSGGTSTPGNQWTLGSIYKYPEFNCCGCGKGNLITCFKVSQNLFDVVRMAIMVHSVGRLCSDKSSSRINKQ